MRNLTLLGKVCTGALVLAISSTAFSSSFKDRIFIEGSYGTGKLKANPSSIDVERISLGGGIDINDNLFVGGGYSTVDFVDANADLLKGYAGYQEWIAPKVAIYGTLGLLYWNSSDIDETETGYGAGVGIMYGDSRIRFKIGFDLMDGLEDDAIFSQIEVFTIGIRYNFGTAPNKARQRSGSTSMKETTACKEGYEDLFPMCEQDKEATGE